MFSLMLQKSEGICKPVKEANFNLLASYKQCETHWNTSSGIAKPENINLLLCNYVIVII